MLLVVWPLLLLWRWKRRGLDLVELIMSLEEEFGTEISDEDAEKIRTVQDAVDYIDERST